MKLNNSIGRDNLEGGQGTIRYREFQEDGDHEVILFVREIMY